MSLCQYLCFCFLCLHRNYLWHSLKHVFNHSYSLYSIISRIPWTFIVKYCHHVKCQKAMYVVNRIIELLTDFIPLLLTKLTPGCLLITSLRGQNMWFLLLMKWWSGKTLILLGKLFANLHFISDLMWFLYTSLDNDLSL